MNSAVAPAVLARQTSAPTTERPRERATRIGMLLLLMAGALLLSFAGVRLAGYQASSDAGYWLGVSGGLMLLVVFAYPLRKRLPLMRRWGAARHWFAVHMVCGIAGPLVIVVHSGFHIGSINAGVALTSMLLVAGSGILGRFIYLRVHRGLSGAHWTLRDLQQQIGASSDRVHSQLGFAPQVEALLKAFHQRVQAPAPTLQARWRAFFAASWQARRLRRRCRRELAIALKARAAGAGWQPRHVKRALVRAMRMVDDYVDAVQRAAQLGAYERLFALWHVLHVPLVWMLVASAVAHVVAVHAY